MQKYPRLFVPSSDRITKYSSFYSFSSHSWSGLCYQLCLGWWCKSVWSCQTNGNQCAQLQDIHLGRNLTIVRSIGDKNAAMKEQWKKDQGYRHVWEHWTTTTTNTSANTSTSTGNRMGIRIYRLLSINHTEKEQE